MEHSWQGRYEMTPEERLYTAMCGGQPDRVPVLPKIWIDLAATLTGTPLDVVLEDPFLATRLVVEAAKAVRSDGARVFFFPKRRVRWEGSTLLERTAAGEVLGGIDAQGGLATCVPDDYSIPLEDPHTIAFMGFLTRRAPLIQDCADVKRMAVPDKRFYDDLGYGACLAQLQQDMGESIALVGDCGTATLAWHVVLRHMDNALTDLILQPDLAHAVMEKGVAIAIEKGKFHIDHGLRILRLNDSVASMSVISPEMWRAFIFPHMKTVCDELHRYHPEVRIYCHICGNSLPIMHDLLEAGIDCIAPLDPLGGFTCRQAREVVGPGVALMGGVHTLSFVDATPEALRMEARACIDGAGHDGAFILGSGCALPPASKRENLLALREAAEE